MTGRPQRIEGLLEPVGRKPLDRVVDAHCPRSIRIKPTNPSRGCPHERAGITQLSITPCGKLRPGRSEAPLDAASLRAVAVRPSLRPQPQPDPAGYDATGISQRPIPTDTIAGK